MQFLYDQMHSLLSVFVHLLPFSWFLSFATSKYWANEESHIYLTQVQLHPACLFGALCDFIDLDTVYRNNHLRVYLKEKAQHRSILQKIKNHRLKVKTKPRVSFLDSLKVCSVHLQEGVHRAELQKRADRADQSVLIFSGRS